jgi:hypothetical protein
MKAVTVKYKSGGCTIVSNVIDELVVGNAHYILTVDTDIDVSTTRKMIDGFYVDSRNSQSYKIVVW